MVIITNNDSTEDVVTAKETKMKAKRLDSCQMKILIKI